MQSFEVELYHLTKIHRLLPHENIRWGLCFIFGYLPPSTRIRFPCTTFIARSIGNHRLISSRSSGLLDPVTILRIPPMSDSQILDVSAMKVWFSPRASICSPRNPFYVSSYNFTNLHGTRDSIYRPVISACLQMKISILMVTFG